MCHISFTDERNINHSPSRAGVHRHTITNIICTYIRNDHFFQAKPKIDEYKNIIIKRKQIEQ